MARDLTVREVAGLSHVGQRRVSKNLYLQVTPTGTKSWLFRYTRGGVHHWVGLGSIELVSLADARARAMAYRRLLLDGKDPLEQRRTGRVQAVRAATRGMLFATCAERYISAHAAGWKNGKHRAQWSATLATYAHPVIGEMPVAAVDTDAIMKILEPIWTTKTATAARVRGRIEAVLDWAAARGYREGANPARWRGHLDKLLAKRTKVAPIKHYSALPYTEIPAFMAELRELPGIPAACLEFTILTAARVGEARCAQWSELDLAARTWTVPAARMKSGAAHVVPLSERVLEIIALLPNAGDYLFLGARASRPIGAMAMTTVLQRIRRADLTVHGFRSAFRDWAAEQTNHQNHVVEMALAHTIGDKTEAAYRRGDLLEKRRTLMRDWMDYCNEG
jgi:integrase